MGMSGCRGIGNRRSWVGSGGIKVGYNCKFSMAAPARPAGISTSQFLRGTNSIAATNSADGGQSTDRPRLETTILAPSLAARYDTRMTRSARRAVRVTEERFVRNGGALLLPTRRWA